MINRAERSFGYGRAGNSLTRTSSQEDLSRRRFLQKAAAGLGVAAVTAIGAQRVVLPYATKTYEKMHDTYGNIGGDYSNWPFIHGVGAHVIDRTRLDELLGSNQEATEVALGIVAVEAKENPEALAEYDIVLDQDGPVFAEFEGLYGDKVSLTILRAVIDSEEEFLVPLLRDENEQTPLVIQLGEMSAGGHKIELFEQYAPTPTTTEEAIPRITQETGENLRGIIDQHQPDIYLKDYDDIANNFPRRSYASVLEIDPSTVALVYTTECFDEDEVLGLFGTPFDRLVETKNRPTDNDWGVEMVVGLPDRHIQLLNICEPYHNRQEVRVDPDRPAERIAIQIASVNNNVKMADASVLKKPKFRVRPTIITFDEMKAAVRDTDLSSARWALCENNDENKVNPENETHAAILGRYGLNLEACDN